MWASDRAAIVTGAASGQGKATALLAASQGAGVLCMDVSDPQPTVDAIERSGGRARAVVADVRDATAWKQVVALAERELGGVYLLANIAGVCPAAQGRVDTVVEVAEEEWRRVIEINMNGVWLGMRSVLPAMIERGEGRIVNVSSLAATRGLPNLAAYSASKGAVVALTRQAAIEYAASGIRINAITPGSIDTPMNKHVPPDQMAGYLAGTPLGRAGRAEEVAAAILFLASPEADFITGQTIGVDGGWSAQG